MCLLHEREHTERGSKLNTESTEASQDFTPPDDIQIGSESADRGTSNIIQVQFNGIQVPPCMASAACAHSARRVIQGTHTL